MKLFEWDTRMEANASSPSGASTDAFVYQERGSEGGERALVPGFFHVLTAAWIAALLLFAYSSPGRYSALLQEDRIVEWGTVWLFLVAGLAGVRQSFHDRRIFDGLVALFCLFIAGEEFSWGQRLLGFGSPEYFLANNYQQEVNLHNLPGSVLKPKWILIASLAGYGVLLPLLARFNWSHRLLKLVGATPPPIPLVPWFIAAIALLLWYPVTLTGEWVEFLAGSLFLASTRIAPTILLILLSCAFIFGITLTKATDAIESDRDAARTPCATIEAQRLLDDMISGEAATEKMRRKRFIHKRIWTAAHDGYLNPAGLRQFSDTRCSDLREPKVTERRSYGVDPWGMSYWLYLKKIDKDQQRVIVYSFGPNRRRDGEAGEPAGDDIAAGGVLYRQNE